MKNNRTTNKILISILVIFFVAMLGYCVAAFNNFEEINTVYADQAGINGTVIEDYTTSYSGATAINNDSDLTNWLSTKGTSSSMKYAKLTDDITLNLTNSSNKIMDYMYLDGCGKTITLNVSYSFYHVSTFNYLEVGNGNNSSYDNVGNSPFAEAGSFYSIGNLASICANSEIINANFVINFSNDSNNPTKIDYSETGKRGAVYGGLFGYMKNSNMKNCSVSITGNLEVYWTDSYKNVQTNNDKGNKMGNQTLCLGGCSGFIDGGTISNSKIYMDNNARLFGWSNGYEHWGNQGHVRVFLGGFTGVFGNGAYMYNMTTAGGGYLDTNLGDLAKDDNRNKLTFAAILVGCNLFNGDTYGSGSGLSAGNIDGVINGWQGLAHFYVGLNNGYRESDNKGEKPYDNHDFFAGQRISDGKYYAHHFYMGGIVFGISATGKATNVQYLYGLDYTLENAIEKYASVLGATLKSGYTYTGLVETNNTTAGSGTPVFVKRSDFKDCFDNNGNIDTGDHKLGAGVAAEIYDSSTATTRSAAQNAMNESHNDFILQIDLKNGHGYQNVRELGLEAAAQITFSSDLSTAEPQLFFDIKQIPSFSSTPSMFAWSAKIYEPGDNNTEELVYSANMYETVDNMDDAHNVQTYTRNFSRTRVTKNTIRLDFGYAVTYSIGNAAQSAADTTSASVTLPSKEYDGTARTTPLIWLFNDKAKSEAYSSNGFAIDSIWSVYKVGTEGRLGLDATKNAGEYTYQIYNGDKNSKYEFLDTTNNIVAYRKDNTSVQEYEFTVTQRELDASRVNLGISSDSAFTYDAQEHTYNPSDKGNAIIGDDVVNLASKYLKITYDLTYDLQPNVNYYKDEAGSYVLLGQIVVEGNVITGFTNSADPYDINAKYYAKTTTVVDSIKNVGLYEVSLDGSLRNSNYKYDSDFLANSTHTVTITPKEIEVTKTGITLEDKEYQGAAYEYAVSYTSGAVVGDIPNVEAKKYRIIYIKAEGLVRDVEYFVKNSDDTYSSVGTILYSAKDVISGFTGGSYDSTKDYYYRGYREVGDLKNVDEYLVQLTTLQNYKYASTVQEETIMKITASTIKVEFSNLHNIEYAARAQKATYGVWANSLTKQDDNMIEGTATSVEGAQIRIYNVYEQGAIEVTWDENYTNFTTAGEYYVTIKIVDTKNYRLPTVAAGYVTSANGETPIFDILEDYVYYLMTKDSSITNAETFATAKASHTNIYELKDGAYLEINAYDENVTDYYYKTLVPGLNANEFALYVNAKGIYDKVTDTIYVRATTFDSSETYYLLTQDTDLTNEFNFVDNARYIASDDGYVRATEYAENVNYYEVAADSTIVDQETFDSKELYVAIEVVTYKEHEEAADGTFYIATERKFASEAAYDRITEDKFVKNTESGVLELATGYVVGETYYLLEERVIASIDEFNYIKNVTKLYVENDSSYVEKKDYEEKYVKTRGVAQFETLGGENVGITRRVKIDKATTELLRRVEEKIPSTDVHYINNGEIYEKYTAITAAYQLKGRKDSLDDMFGVSEYASANAGLIFYRKAKADDVPADINADGYVQVGTYAEICANYPNDKTTYYYVKDAYSTVDIVWLDDTVKTVYYETDIYNGYNSTPVIIKGTQDVGKKTFDVVYFQETYYKAQFDSETNKFIIVDENGSEYVSAKGLYIVEIAPYENIAINYKASKYYLVYNLEGVSATITIDMVNYVDSVEYDMQSHEDEEAYKNSKIDGLVRKDIKDNKDVNYRYYVENPTYTEADKLEIETKTYAPVDEIRAAGNYIVLVAYDYISSDSYEVAYIVKHDDTNAVKEITLDGNKYNYFEVEVTPIDILVSVDDAQKTYKDTFEYSAEDANITYEVLTSEEYLTPARKAIYDAEKASIVMGFESAGFAETAAAGKYFIRIAPTGANSQNYNFIAKQEIDANTFYYVEAAAIASQEDYDAIEDAKYVAKAGGGYQVATEYVSETQYYIATMLTITSQGEFDAQEVAHTTLYKANENLLVETEEYVAGTTFTVNKYTLNLVVNESVETQKEYGTPFDISTITYADDYLDELLTGDDLGTITLSSLAVSNTANAGEYDIVATADGPSAGNYEIVVDKKIVVNPIHISVSAISATSKIYDGEELLPTVTYLGLAFESDAAGIVAVFTYGEDGLKAINVGDYVGYVSALSGEKGGNYILDVNEETTVEFEITTRAITISTENMEIGYGALEILPESGSGIDYEVGSLNIVEKDLEGLKFVSDDQASAPGEYANSIGIALDAEVAGNYTISYASKGTLTIVVTDLSSINLKVTETTFDGTNQMALIELDTQGEGVEITKVYLKGEGEEKTEVSEVVNAGEYLVWINTTDDSHYTDLTGEGAYLTFNVNRAQWTDEQITVDSGVVAFYNRVEFTGPIAEYIDSIMVRIEGETEALPYADSILNKKLKSMTKYTFYIKMAESINYEATDKEYVFEATTSFDPTKINSRLNSLGTNFGYAKIKDYQDIMSDYQKVGEADKAIVDSTKLSLATQRYNTLKSAGSKIVKITKGIAAKNTKQSYQVATAAVASGAGVIAVGLSCFLARKKKDENEKEEA